MAYNSEAKNTKNNFLKANLCTKRTRGASLLEKYNSLNKDALG